MRGRPRDPRRREAILQAALELVAEVGYDRASIDAIALRAHVSKPTIYRRWSGKRQLLVEAITSRHRDEGAPADHGSLRADLLAAIERSRDKLLDDIPLAGGMITQMRQSEELCQLIHEEVTAQERLRFELPVQRAVQRGELPQGSQAPDLFAEIAPSIIFTRVIITREDVGESFAQELVDQILLPILGATS